MILTRIVLAPDYQKTVSPMHGFAPHFLRFQSRNSGRNEKDTQGRVGGGFRKERGLHEINRLEGDPVTEAEVRRYGL